jgi:hypothetical protein
MRCSSVALLYVETNLLIAAATARDAQASPLINGDIPQLQILIPGICFLEAMKWMEDELKRRKEFRRSLKIQIGQLQRDVSGSTRALEYHLEQAIVEDEQVERLTSNRLILAIQGLSSHAVILPVTAAILENSRKEILIGELTDNLIASTILDHARSASVAAKALLTENSTDFDQPVVKKVMRAAGVIYFRDSDRVAAWSKSVAGDTGG